MSTRESYRLQAEALRKLAKDATDPDQAFAYNLRAVEYDHLADEAEAGQVEQHGTQPPPAPPASQDQPAQQQQQVQPDDKDE